MTKTMIGFFVFGCGGADVGFSGSLSVELDGAVDARVVMGNGGRVGTGGRSGSSGSGTGGIDVNDPRSGADPACGPYRYCIGLTSVTIAELVQFGCVTDDDCCKSYHCNTDVRVGGRCMLPQDDRWPADREMCASNADCPCAWECVQMYEQDGGPYGHHCVPVFR